MPMSNFSVRQALRQGRDGAVWRPSRAKLLFNQKIGRHRNIRAGYGDEEHLRAAAGWLARAQDATGDGGVSGRFRLNSGWTSSYPETTGYIIPTFLALADEEWGGEFKERARRAIEFLLPLQLEAGGFPGGEIRTNKSQPSFFNTAQIIAGLVAWHRASDDERALLSARRAADWLLSFQDDDGAFRKHLYEGLLTTYGAHASCWIAELGTYTGESRYLDAAGRHMRWVLGHQDADTDWIDRCGFTAADHDARRAVTHTIAYTLWGVLATATALNDRQARNAVERAALKIARRVELTGWLPGVLDSRWNAAASYACLTGNAQMALIWFALYEHTNDSRFLNAALKVIDLVKLAQPMTSSEPGIRGGVPGSDPVWGGYIRMAIPNWAAKFYIDALLKKRQMLSSLPSRPRGVWTPLPDVPQALPAGRATAPAGAVRVVVLAQPTSRKAVEMLRGWDGFRPHAVIVAHGRAATIEERLWPRIRDEGFVDTLTRKRRKRRRPAVNADVSASDLRPLCEQRGIPIVDVESLESPKDLERISALEPDLFVLAGGGILRKALLTIPRLGTLNAHMGVLPFYRGMNVTEWACFHGDPAGCSVHLIDPGIDTGDVFCVRVVDITNAGTVDDARGRVHHAQLALLHDVVKFVTSTGTLPPARPQAPEEGRQFFRMHPELIEIVERELNHK